MLTLCFFRWKCLHQLQLRSYKILQGEKIYPETIQENYTRTLNPLKTEKRKMQNLESDFSGIQHKLQVYLPHQWQKYFYKRFVTVFYFSWIIFIKFLSLRLCLSFISLLALHVMPGWLGLLSSRPCLSLGLLSPARFAARANSFDHQITGRPQQTKCLSNSLGEIGSWSGR